MAQPYSGPGPAALVWFVVVGLASGGCSRISRRAVRWGKQTITRLECQNVSRASRPASAWFLVKLSASFARGLGRE